MENILILASGQAKRYNGENKSLVPINDKALILHTCGQLKSRGNIYIITNNKETEDVCSKDGYQVFHPKHTNTMLHTIKSTHELWGDRTIILYSDTVYSNQVMGFIFELTTLAFVSFRNKTEGLAIVVTKKFYETFMNGINNIMNVPDVDTHPHPKLYAEIKKTLGYDISACIPKDDYTTDFDYQHEYNTFKREIINKNLL